MNTTTLTMPVNIELDELLQSRYWTPIGSQAQHVFDICYRYVVQNNISERTIRFLYMYTFCRNMIGTLIIESLLIFYISYYINNYLISLFGIFLLLLIIPFYSRFNQFGFSFAKEVIYSCYIDLKKN